MILGNLWLYSLFAAIGIFQVVAVFGLVKKRNDYADVAWGPAFPLAAAIGAAAAGVNLLELDLRSGIVLALLSVWAIRLFAHVGWRNLSHAHEDQRYANWRRQWGHTWLWRSYLQVFVLQALILYVFLTPVLLVLSSPAAPLGWLGVLGIAAWLFGFVFEAVADEQLRRFKNNSAHRGKLITSGLWSWSRHPNYFGEVTQWWGLWLLALELPYGWTTILSPLGVTYLIMNVSGVSMLEDLMRSRPGYEQYAQTTSRFIPWPPAKKEEK